MCWPGPPTHRKTSCSTSSTPPRPRPWSASSPTPRALQLRPRPHPTHPVRGPGPHPSGPGPSAGGRGVGGPVRRPPRVTRRRTGPPLVQRHPTRSTWPKPSTTRAGRPTPRSLPSPPPTPSATTPRPSTSTPESDEPDPILGIDLAIGLGTAQRQTGDPAFRDTLLDAARRAADLDDTERLVAAALANNRGIFSAVGTIDADKVEILEMALDRLAPDDPDRALVLATLCAELTFGSPLERRQALADEAVALARVLRRRRHHRARPQPRLVPAPRAAPARTVAGPVGRRPGSGRAAR